VSALISSKGKPRQVVSIIQQSGFIFFYPKQLIEELQEVPEKPRLAPKISSSQIERLVTLIESRGRLVELDSVVLAVSRDPKDDPFLACAQSVGCNYLVTGDKDMLVLQFHGTTKILTPAGFLSVLESGGEDG